MNETFEKIYNENNTGLNRDTALFEKVYAEAEMLNEMNPKLRALLAAGLIGTAGLGAASCSMPTDDPYDVQYTIEQPTPENPEDSENPVTFETLGVTPEHAARLARADKFEENLPQITEYEDEDHDINYHSLIYKNNEDGFVEINFNLGNEHIDSDGQYNDGHSYISYINDTDDTDWYLYYIPVSMESDFDTAIAAYKAAHAE